MPATTDPAPAPPICDYEGDDYRRRFWHPGARRDYEDRVERLALRRLLPEQGAILIDVGAGYGRLADEYGGYGRVVLFDYSRSLLREAQARLRGDDRFLFVAGNFYQMPFVPGLFDALVQVRSLHHAADAPAVLRQLARVARPRAAYVLEFANKQNLKAIARYAAGRQSWSPFNQEPVEFEALNFDYHPRWLRQQLAQAGFVAGSTLTVSHFRLAPLKRALPTGWLVALDGLIQPTGRLWQLSPSVFVGSRRLPGGGEAPPGAFFACPHCQTPLPAAAGDLILCPGPDCGRCWRVQDGLYDFKEPVTG